MANFIPSGTADSITGQGPYVPWEEPYLSTESSSKRTIGAHSTVTLLARLRGLSTSVPRAQAVW
jgi:hypothetical protein